MKRIAVLLFVCWASYAQYVPPAGSGGGGGGSGTVTHTAGSLTANQLVIGNGAADITVLGSLGTTSTVLHGNAAGAPSYAAVALGTEVSGTLLAAQFPALTGDVTTTVGSLATTIGAARVTNAMLAGSIAASNLIGSDITTVGTVATGTWQATKLGLAYGGTNADLSATGGTSQVLKQTSVGGAITVARLACADLSNAATTCSSATAGTPPFSAITAGTNAAALLVGTGGSLGTSGTGTIAATSVTNLTLANTLTTSGNFPLTLTTTASTSVTLPTSGTLMALPSLTSGGVLYASSTSAVSSSALLASGGVILGGGAGAAPVTDSNITWNAAQHRLIVTNGAVLSSGGVFYVLGSVGTPGLADANTGTTGVFFPGTATAFSVSGVERGRFGTTTTFQIGDLTATTGATRFVISLGAADSATTVTSTNNGTTKAAGYQSSDGSAGVTGATCTSFKNGLCVTL